MDFCLGRLSWIDRMTRIVHSGAFFMAVPGRNVSNLQAALKGDEQWVINACLGIFLGNGCTYRDIYRSRSTGQNL